MKFLAALFAKLTGQADAPKTLDQARATYGEAKAALDRIAALFTAASLDLDELLAKGEASLKDFIASLNTKVSTAEAAATEAQSKTTAAEQKATEITGQLTVATTRIAALDGLLASIGFKPAADASAEDIAAALQLQFKAHISGAVQQQMAELGQPGKKLPAASSTTAEDTLEDIQSKMATTTDPQELGRLASKANVLRDKLRAGGRN